MVLPVGVAMVTVVAALLVVAEAMATVAGGMLATLHRADTRVAMEWSKVSKVVMIVLAQLLANQRMSGLLRATRLLGPTDGTCTAQRRMANATTTTTGIM